MKRRQFIKGASFVGVVLGDAHKLVAIEKNPFIKNDDDEFELNELTITELQLKIKTRRLTSEKITALYLQRIEQLNTKGPKLNAVIEINPDAMAIARKMDEERRGGKSRGPLHGIPVLIKDNIDSGDHMQTTAGSLALLGNHAAEDAFIVKKLRDAGAVLLGKTNLSEWSNFRSSNSASGWSSRGGQTKNPYVLDRNPSGSSAGSGVGVAANLCMLAVGTETDGSIIAPASINGIVGIKPTVGLWSRTGIIPISKTQDTAGPMARTVKDAAILLGSLCGIDDNDDATKQSAGKIENDYTRYLMADGLAGARIGVEKSHLEGRAGVSDLLKQAIDVMKGKGATIVEVDFLKQYRSKDYKEFTVLQYEFKDGVNRYLAKANAQVKSLAEVIAFNKKNEEKAMPFFKQETLESCERKGSLSEKEYVDAISARPTIKKFFDDTLEEQTLQAICGISYGPAGAIDLVNGDYNTGFFFSPPAAVTGYPHITVPMGRVHHLPVGLSFMSGAYKEGVILKFAYAYEQATKKRERPGFIKTLIQ